MQTVWTVNAKRRGFTVLAVSIIHVELSRAPVASSYLSVSTAKYKVSVNSGGVDCQDWFLVWSRAAVVFTPAPISHCCLWPKQQLLIFLFFYSYMHAMFTTCVRNKGPQVTAWFHFSRFRIFTNLTLLCWQEFLNLKCLHLKWISVSAK